MQSHVRPALLLAALVLAVAVYWQMHRYWGSPGNSTDVVSEMDPQSLIRRATELVNEKHSYESLPFYRRLLALSRGGNASVHCAYSMALYNSLSDPDSTAGFARPMWRTSPIRVGIIGECMAHLDTAIALAGSSRERAGFEVRRALMLSAWGFQYEANEALRLACSDDPGNSRYQAMADQQLRAMRNPVTTPGIAIQEGKAGKGLDAEGLRGP